MNIECPALNISKTATENDLSEALAALPGKEDPYVILSKTDMTYMQALWTEDGFILEYQENSIAHHYISIRRLSLEQVTCALINYLNGSNLWKVSVQFENKNITSASWSIGHWLGKTIGGLFRVFKSS